MRAAETFEVTEYAAISAELAEPSGDRAKVLASHDLDEETWNAVDQRFQDAMSREMNEEHEGAPPLVAAYADAFARARAALYDGGVVLSVERFGDATREIQQRGDALAALSKLGITLNEFLQANEHWTRRMLADPEIFARYRSRLR